MPTRHRPLPDIHVLRGIITSCESDVAIKLGRVTFASRATYTDALGKLNFNILLSVRRRLFIPEVYILFLFQTLLDMVLNIYPYII